MTLPKVSLLLAVVLVVATIVAAGLPETTQLRPRPVAWAEFENEQVEFECPQGFRADDPYHLDLPYRGFGWLTDVPAPQVGMAFLSAYDGSTEAFLVRGPAAELEPLVQGAEAHYRGDPRVARGPDHALLLDSGATLRIRKVHLLAGDPPGDPRSGFVALLGVARIGDEMVILNAGGPADSFQEDALLRMMRTMRLPTP